MFVLQIKLDPEKLREAEERSAEAKAKRAAKAGQADAPTAAEEATEPSES